MDSCEVCGKSGAPARACRFDRGCSCWRGIPCGEAQGVMLLEVPGQGRLTLDIPLPEPT